MTPTEAALDRVRALHEPIDALHCDGPRQTRVQVCAHCSTIANDDGPWVRWPCRTWRAAEVRDA